MNLMKICKNVIFERDLMETFSVYVGLLSEFALLCLGVFDKSDKCVILPTLVINRIFTSIADFIYSYYTNVIHSRNECRNDLPVNRSNISIKKNKKISSAVTFNVTEMM